MEQSGMAGQVMGVLSRRRVWPGLRMTPMIDVIFLLLTFFVLTVQFERPEQALPLVFGATAVVPATPPQALELAIVPNRQGCAVKTADGEAIVIIQESPAAGLAALAERMQAAAQEGGKKPIKIDCDDAVSWELVTRIYDVLYAMGARDITFVIKE